MARSNLSSLKLGAPDNRSLLRGDTLRITSMRGLRQIAYGMMAVILAIALTRAGLSPAAIGLLVSVFPANVHMAVNPEQIRDLDLKEIPRWALWAQLPLQPLAMLWVWRETRD